MRHLPLLVLTTYTLSYSSVIKWQMVPSFFNLIIRRCAGSL